MRFQLAAATLVLAVAARVRAEDVTLSLAAKDGGFEPAQIEAPAGGKAQLEVSN